MVPSTRGHPACHGEDPWAMALDGDGACPREDIRCLTLNSEQPSRRYLDRVPDCTPLPPEATDPGLVATELRSVVEDAGMQARHVCKRGGEWPGSPA